MDSKRKKFDMAKVAKVAKNRMSVLSVLPLLPLLPEQKKEKLTKLTLQKNNKARVNANLVCNQPRLLMVGLLELSTKRVVTNAILDDNELTVLEGLNSLGSSVNVLYACTLEVLDTDTEDVASIRNEFDNYITCIVTTCVELNLTGISRTDTVNLLAVTSQVGTCNFLSVNRDRDATLAIAVGLIVNNEFACSRCRECTQRNSSTGSSTEHSTAFERVNAIPCRSRQCGVVGFLYIPRVGSLSTIGFEETDQLRTISEGVRRRTGNSRSSHTSVSHTECLKINVVSHVREENYILSVNRQSCNSSNKEEKFLHNVFIFKVNNIVS